MGEFCIAPDFLYVHESVVEKVVDEIKKSVYK